MNPDIIQGKWTQIKGSLKAKWGKLTDDDLTEINGKRTDLVARVDGRRHPNAGETVTLAPIPGHMHVFDVASGERLTDKPVVSA